jgi:hypothetical protein
MNCRVCLIVLCVNLLAAGISGAQTMPAGDAAALYAQANAECKVYSPACTDMTYPDYPPYSPEWQKVEGEAFAANQEAFALAHRAGQMDHADWPKDIPRDKTAVNYLNPLRNLANQLGDAALYLDLKGEDAQAIGKINDLLHLADLLDGGANTEAVQALVATGIRAIAMDRMMVVSSSIRLTKDPADTHGVQLADAQQLVVRLLDRAGADDEMKKISEADVKAMKANYTSQRMIAVFKRIGTERNLAAMSLACHIFFFEHDRWPTSIDELIQNEIANPLIDPFGNGEQSLGYVLIKGGLPDGSDRPLVYSRENSGDGLFFHLDRPEYDYYADDGTASKKQGGQFRDVARWVPSKTGTGATTQPLP